MLNEKFSELAQLKEAEGEQEKRRKNVRKSRKKRRYKGHVGICYNHFFSAIDKITKME